MVLGLALSNNPGQGEQNTLDGGQGCCWIIAGGVIRFNVGL